MQNLERTQKVLSVFQQRALGVRPPESPESERYLSLPFKRAAFFSSLPFSLLHSPQSGALCYGARHRGHSHSLASTRSIWPNDTTTLIRERYMPKLWVTIERYCR